MTVYRFTSISSNRIDEATGYVGNPTPDRLAWLYDNATRPVVDVGALPEMELPTPATRLLADADMASLTWHLQQPIGARGTTDTILTIFDLTGPEGATFTWHGNRLFTYGLPMPLKRAHQLIAQITRERVLASIQKEQV